MGPSLPPPPASAGAPSAPDMSLVNLAARQRMLSQRLVLQTVRAAAGADGQLEAARATLALFAASQARLLDTPRAMDPASAAVIRAAYDGPRGAHAAVDAFRAQAEAALDRIARQDRRQAQSLDALVAQADSVLDPLNRATSAFDAVARTRQDAVAQEIGAIVTSIQRVAREAKVVSFNAQVIAARAGQHGREFAVVAQVLSTIAGQVDGLSQQAVRLSDRRAAA